MIGLQAVYYLFNVTPFLKYGKSKPEDILIGKYFFFPFNTSIIKDAS